MLLGKRNQTTFIIVLVSVLTLSTLLYLKADNVATYNSDTDALWAYNDFNNAKQDYILEWVQMIVLNAERVALSVAYDSNQSEMQRGAYDLASDAIPTSFGVLGNIKDTAKNAAKLAITHADDLALRKALIDKTLALQKKTVVVAQDKTTMDNYYSHYLAHVAAYNKTTSQTKTATAKGKIPTDTVSFTTDLEVKCSNPDCSTVYSASVWGLDNIVALSEGGSLGSHRGHLVMCNDQAHPGHQYWSCPSHYPGCGFSTLHWRLCPGTCGKKFPPKKANRGHGYYTYYNASPHKVVCRERVYDGFWNVILNFCYLKYDSAWYTCERSSCPNSTYHNDDEDEANAGGTLHACNIHDTSVPGDHSSTWLCNESPCSNRQVPYCLAMCPYTGTHGTATTPSMHACNIHPTSDSGDHTSTYLCNISPCSNRVVPSCLAICPETDNHGKVVCTISGCQNSTPYDPTSSSAGLHAYHFECSQYKCNGVDHSWRTSCSDTAHTNTNGDSCTASGFYECVSHTPVYLSSDNGNNDNDDSSTQVRCGHCDEDYDPQWDGEEHTRIWICSFCGQDYISCLDEVCTSSSYGHHYPR